jgi:hypothetical protein
MSEETFVSHLHSPHMVFMTLILVIYTFEVGNERSRLSTICKNNCSVNSISVSVTFYTDTLYINYLLYVSAMVRYEQPLLTALLIPYFGQGLQWVYFVTKVTLQYAPRVNNGQFKV